MTNKLKGRTSKMQMALLLEFFRENKKNKYCMHEIGKLYGVRSGDASTNLSKLYHWGFLRLASKGRCEDRKNVNHTFYQYHKGDKDAVLGRRFSGVKVRKKAVAKKIITKKYGKRKENANNQTEKVMTVPVTIRVRINLE